MFDYMILCVYIYIIIIHPDCITRFTDYRTLWSPNLLSLRLQAQAQAMDQESIWVLTQKIGVKPQKMDGENNGKPY